MVVAVVVVAVVALVTLVTVLAVLAVVAVAVVAVAAVVAVVVRRSLVFGGILGTLQNPPQHTSRVTNHPPFYEIPRRIPATI
jgi:hypothetical protein